MSKKRISFRLNTHITSIAILIIASIVYINYHFTKRVLIGKIEEGAINQSNFVISRIARITVGAEEIAKNVSFQALYYQKNNDLKFFLEQVQQSNKVLENIDVELFNYKENHIQHITSHNEIVNGCDSVNLKIEDYTAKFKDQKLDLNHGYWTDPYICNSDKSELLISYKIPIFSQLTKKIGGVVSCEISVSKLNQLLNEIRIGEKGYAFIIDKKGNYVTHPNKEWILSKNLFEKPSIIFHANLQEIETKIINGGVGVGHGVSPYLNYQKAWFYYSPLSNSNWEVIIVFPENELFQEINLIFQKIILVSGLGIIVIFLLNIFVFWRILDPLVRITYAIQRFSSNPSKERNSKNEIKMLAESLEDWQAKYGILIADQSKTAGEKLKFEKDMARAREIHLNIVPQGKPVFPDYPEIDLFAILKPAEIIGGDLYDYFFIDKDHLLIAIGDVSGKGIPASLFMAIASTLIKSNAKILSAKDIVSLVNNELSERNSNQYFVTLFLGILDIRSWIMDYCNAAHNYPYILHSNGTLQTLSKSHGLPLGIYKDKIYKSSTIEFSFGDTLLLYTDGVINARDTSGQHYGTEKLEHNIHNLNNLTSEEIVSQLLKSIIFFEGEKNQADDISIMAIKYLNKTKNQA